MRSFFAVVALCGFATVASADDDDARARAVVLFDQGKAHYEANELQLAIEKFKQAYELAKDPVYLFNLAQAYRNAADCEQGFDYYNRYLEEDPSAANADSVRRWIEELRPCANRIKALSTKAPAPAPVVSSVPSPTVVQPTQQTIDRGSGLRTVGVLTAGAGTMALVVGIIYGVKAQSYENEIATACMRSCMWDDLASRDDAGQRANKLAWVGYIGGGLALGVGIGLYIVGTTKVERVTVMPSGDGATVSARLSF
jgi:tetratricopeptide (TPR) repeat protein